MHSYYRREYLGGIAALWNAQDAFIFIQVNSTVERVPVLNSVGSGFLGDLVARDSYTVKRLLCFRVSRGVMHEYTQEQFDITGQLLPFHDMPHLIQGGYEIKAYGWTEKGFVKTDNETLKALQRYAADGKAFTQSGWNKLDWEELGIIGDNYDRTITINKGVDEATLHIITGSSERNGSGYVIRNAPAKVILFFAREARTLVDISQEFRRISAKEFADVKIESSGPNRRQ
jgi:hypothetical protein